jgi:hypothetical protein
MKEIKITKEMIDYAIKESNKMGSLKNSITSGDGNIVGFLGELIATQNIGGMIDNTYDYDILLDDFQTTVDVKTKKTTVKPLDHYECSVAEYNIKQKCDYYCFVRIKTDLSVGWYLGAYKKNDYFKDATKLIKGDIDPSNNFIVKANCFNLKISQLNPSLLLY